MDRFLRERKELRRVFTRSANALEGKIKDDAKADVKEDYEYLGDVAERMLAVDRDIYNLALDSEELYNEREFEKMVDEAEAYKKRWISIRARCEQRVGEAKREGDLQSETGSAVTARSCRNLKLPKLELRKFDDDPKNWLGFWGQFKKIHEDNILSDDDKYQYLVQAMKEDSNARELVQCFPPCGKSYHTALEHLKSRFAREEVLVETYVRELLRLVLCQAKGDFLMDIRSLYDKLMTYLQALDSLGVTKDKYEAMLFPLVESALPESILLAWGRSRAQKPKCSDQLAQLLTFLRYEVESEERIRLSRSEFNTGPSSSSYGSHRENTKITPTAACIVSNEVKEVSRKTEGKCQICYFCDKTSHTVVECNKAGKMSLDEKKEALKKNSACYICLKKGHMSKFCRNRAYVSCLSCSKRHLVIMCPDLHKPKVNNPKINSNQCLCLKNKTTLLQTLIVEVQNNGKVKKVRALLDSGSQRSYVMTNVVEELNLKVVGTESLGHSLFGGMEKQCEPHRRVQVSVNNLDSSFGLLLTCLEQRKLCGSLPKLNDIDLMHKLNNMNITLSDNSCDEMEIGLLIGSDYLGAIMIDAQTLQLGDNLLAIKTKLGWTVQGPSITTSSGSKTSTLFCYPQDMWDMEVLGITDPYMQKTRQTIEAEQLKTFNDKIKVNEEGRYEVNLLWTEDAVNLDSNYEQALSRLKSVTDKLRNTGYLHGYDEVFKDWVKDGIIQRVFNDSKLTGHYLPHHSVIKLSSVTTKIRPVFDASAKGKNGVSLNSCVDRGVNMIELIPRLLIAFRLGTYGVTADIKKAFLQISLKEEDRKFLKFLWWDNPETCEKVVAYQHNRVVFGVTCSPFLLAATINYHLDSWPEDEFKDTARILRHSFYVDNCIASFNTEAELDRFISQAKHVMLKGKFELREWVTAPKQIAQCQEMSVLGVTWNTNDDTLYCDAKFKKSIPSKVTKRVLLSVTQQVFDPLGFVCPVTLIPRLLTQQAWKHNIGWDEEIPDILSDQFKAWTEASNVIEQCQIPRRLTIFVVQECETSIHVFSDASQHAYSGCIFLRTQLGKKVHVQLIIAKNRVAPPKKLMSLPRLELMGALIASRLYREVQNLEVVSRCKVYCWTDSAVVYAWLHNDVQYKPFVNNRVKEIRTNTRQQDWHHLPGCYNPADLPSRGCNAQTFLEQRWWEGPDWLRSDFADWPRSNISTLEMDEEAVTCEQKRTTVACTDSNVAKFSCYLTKFSKYTKIVRLVAWLLRMSPRVRKEYVQTSYINNNEFIHAEKVVIKILQKEYFYDNNALPGNVNIIKDNDGFIRVKTRLDNMNESEDFKCPVFLPGKHQIVERLIEQRHITLLHANTPTLMTDLRNKFWILSVRRACKTVLSRCIVCKRFKSKHYDMPEAPLPSNRLEGATAFQITGIDLAGPLYLRDRQKVWIVLFTCATYRAVHLELTNSLSTADFMMALRRFIARRGRVSTIYTDNGTNFRGAANLLHKIDWHQVEASTIAQAIKWHFIPPGAPWWGGWWERLIRVVKDILKRMLGKMCVTSQELTTLLCDCEAVVNSRPLTYVSNDPDFLRPLTPMMFLHGLPSSDVPDLDLIDARHINLRYRYLQKLRDDFRQRFRNEYTSLLVSKGSKKATEPRVGDILLINSGEKRINWPVGIVKEVYPGADGYTRVVKLRTATGDKVRPSQKLHPLELNLNDDHAVCATANVSSV